MAAGSVGPCFGCEPARLLALILLLLMNIFPLMWSFGLSFLHYRASSGRAPRFAGLHYYEKVLGDPVVRERSQTTARIVALGVLLQMVIGFPLALLFRTIETFKLFDIVYIITNGGPGTATETIAVYVYRVAFQFFRTSQSSALSDILLFIVIVLTNLYLHFVRRRAQEA